MAMADYKKLAKDEARAGAIKWYRLLYNMGIVHGQTWCHGSRDLFEIAVRCYRTEIEGIIKSHNYWEVGRQEFDNYYEKILKELKKL